MSLDITSDGSPTGELRQNEPREPRTDATLQRTVDNIQRRFLDRVGDRIARGVSRRELAEELIIECLQIARARYGCLLSTVGPPEVLDDRRAPTASGDAVLAIGKMELEPIATVTASDGTTMRRQLDRHAPRRPDRVMRSVLLTGKATFSNQTTDFTHTLPTNCPEVTSYAIVPLIEQGRASALLFVANVDTRIDLNLLKRLQSVVDAFSALKTSEIVSRGIHRVLGDIGRTNRQLASIMQASINGIVTIDETGTITAFNPACERIFEIATRQAIGSKLNRFLPAEAVDQVVERAAELGRSVGVGETTPYPLREMRALQATGEEVPIDANVFHTRFDGRVFSTFVVNDVSEHSTSARELQDTLLQFKTLTKLAPVGIMQLGVDWTCQYANDMWCRLSQMSIEETLNTGWVDAFHADDAARTLEEMRAALHESRTYNSELRLCTRDDSATWVKLSVTGLRNASHTLTGCLVIIMDITEQHQGELRLRQIAHYDALTGLLNRMFFLDRLEQAIESSHRRGDVAVLFLDLDGFKGVNDTFGHDFGDELLKQVAQRLTDAVREEDTVARLGGDEFTITITHLSNSQHAGLVAEKIVNRLRAPFDIFNQEIFISTSIGIAVGNRDNSDASSLIKQADIALYRAKDAGRSRFVFFTHELDRAQRDRSLLINSLRRAVDRNAFELHYQPQLLIDKQELLGFEALLRWPQETGDPIPPEDFINELEETGLIGDVGRWAIEEACRQYMRWRADGLIGAQTTMSVNVSARQLNQPRFDLQIAHILERHAMSPYNLILEITESALVKAVESNIIQKIKTLGVQISLDDFGTGYSSLAYLSQLPLDHLKIDRSFITDIPHKPQALSIVKSIIALARTLDIKVVAEGVEDARVVPVLAAEGCEAYQGFHFSPPMNADDMGLLLRRLDPLTISRHVNFIDLGQTQGRVDLR